MDRYRKELTHPEREINRLAQATRQLRQELEALVRGGRQGKRIRSERVPVADRPPKKP